MPEMAIYRLCISTLFERTTPLHHQDAREEFIGRLASVAHRHILLISSMADRGQRR
jgi:hypothetical protein